MQLSPDATLPEILRSGIIDRFFARGPRDLNRLYADRGAGLRLASDFAGVPGRNLDETAVRAYREMPGAGSTRARDAGLLRHSVNRFQQATGVGAPLGSRARPAPGRKQAPVRVCLPEHVLAPLGVADKLERLLIGIPLGVGATPRNLVALSRGQLVVRRGNRALMLLGSADRLRAVPLPAWLMALVKDQGGDWWRARGHSVFGAATTPDVLGGRLASVARRAGLEPGRLTLTRLYSTFQALAAQHGAANAVIRGRWSMPSELRRRPRHRWPEKVRQLTDPLFSLAEGWSVLSAPQPAWPEWALPKPRGRIRPDEPELRRSRSPLPPGVR